MEGKLSRVFIGIEDGEMVFAELTYVKTDKDGTDWYSSAKYGEFFQSKSGRIGHIHNNQWR